MKPRLLSRDVRSVGYGNHHGHIIHKEYECPCGKGFIVDDDDDIPGFRHRDVWIDCPKCKEKYEIDLSNGINNWDVVLKEEMKNEN